MLNQNRSAGFLRRNRHLLYIMPWLIGFLVFQAAPMLYSLICGFTDTTFSRGSLVWRTALSSEPKLISGEYDAAANTTRGSVVLEYSLGNDLNIRSVVFSELSGVFAGEEMIPFAGSMSLYNYQTGRYDLMPAGQRSFTADAVRPYLSPDNTLTARYVPDESGAAVPMFLPVPDVTGTER